MNKIKIILTNIAKRSYQFLFRCKFFLFHKFYGCEKLEDPKTARESLKNLCPTELISTDYTQPFENEPTLDLSIIIPVYNVQEFLPMCFASIIQDTKFSYEVILVDDGSTDDSAKICDDFAKQHENVRVFHVGNHKVPSFARNFGIVKSRGKKLMFVDSDDKLLDDTLNEMIAQSQNVPILQAKYVTACNNKILSHSKNVDSKNLAKFSGEYGYPWGKIFDREIFSKIKFPLNFWFEDMINDLFIFPSFSEEIKLCDLCLYQYNINPQGITSTSKKSLKIIDTYFVLEELISHTDAMEIDFSSKHFKRLLFQASFQTYVRLRRFDEQIMKNVFVLLCDLVLKTQEKYQITEKSLSRIDRLLVKAFTEKNFKCWKEISIFYR